MKGTFREHPEHRHVALRERLLGEGAAALPHPPRIRRCGSASSPDELADIAAAELAQRGLAVLELERALQDDTYLNFGRRLGTPVAEQAPAVAPYVGHSAILSIKGEHAATADTDLQPFAANWLTLHTEASRAPCHLQPRYISLLCVNPGLQRQAAPTVLVPIPPLLQALPARTRELLGGTRYDLPGAPWLIRRDGPATTLSIRDFHGDPLHWVHDGPADHPAEVNAALAALYAAMYSTAGTRAVTWRAGLLVVIDNARYLHGRRASTDQGPRRQPVRHLKRLRIRTIAQEG